VPGTLYIVATPIGNLEDITLRALRVLKEADLIAAEDTRHTRKLLSHFQIATPLIAYHAHSAEGRLELLLRRLTEDNQSIALVTDAGTPGVSDPGFDLVAGAVSAGVIVVPVPGASAALSALVASGLSPVRFAFEGFLPRTKSSRREKLANLASETRTLILYEAGNRTLETLADIARFFGPDRPAAVGREITKRHEEFVRGSLATVIAHFEREPPRGEITIVVGGRGQDGRESEAGEPEGECGRQGGAVNGVPGCPPFQKTEQVLPAALSAAIASGLSPRDAVKQVSRDLGLSRRDVYAAMLELTEEKGRSY